jgi:hypothetical protein
MLKIKYVVSVSTMALAVFVLLVMNVMKKKVTVFVLYVNFAITRAMPALARLVIAVKKKQVAALATNKLTSGVLY